MKSPFPGMDPFIEACGLWGDFHVRLIANVHDALADALPERYVVRSGERSYVVIEGANGEKSYFFEPDVKVIAPTTAETWDGGESSVATSGVAPMSLRAFIEGEYRETFVEILEAEGDQSLVTSIEVLSPTNKRKGTPAWDLYQRKRQGLLMGAANLVEIDLLRGGQRMPMLDPWPNSPYTLLVARKHLAPTCRVWPAGSLRPLPVIPVPLLKPDPDVSLDLQPMVERIYARSRYHRSINYTVPPVPPLLAEEAAWLAQRSSSPDSAS
jgi:hypothetical protein